MLDGPFANRVLAAGLAVLGCAALEAVHRHVAPLDDLELGGGMLVVLGLSALVAYLPTILSEKPPVREAAPPADALQAGMTRLSAELVTLASFAKITAGADPPATVAQNALRVLSRELALQKLALFESDAETDEIRLLDEVGHAPEESALLRNAVAGSLVEWVVRRRRVYPDPTLDGGAELTAVKVSNRLPVALALPLVAGDDVMGALSVSAFAGSAADLTETGRFLAILASLLALRLQSGALVERVRALAVRDEASGLFLRAHGDDVLDGEVARARRYGQPLAFVVVEVPEWAKLERAHGSGTSARVLHGLGETMQIVRKGIDCGVRFGPGQLALILPHTDDAGALKLGERLLGAIGEGRFLDAKGQPFELPVGIGIATFPAQASTAEGLASAALEAAQVAHGRGGRCAVMVPSVGGEPVVIGQAG